MRLEAREQTPAWLPWVAIFSSSLVTLIFAAALILVISEAVGIMEELV